MGKLDGKVAVITGGGTGMGRVMAMEFANQGASVAVTSRNIANIKKVADEITATDRRAIALVTDVSIKDEVHNMVQNVIKEFGRIDILVNNAGAAPWFSIMDTSEDDLDMAINTNVKGTFFCIQAAGRHMIEQGYGKIINIGSVVGLRPGRPQDVSYGVSKATVHMLTKYAAAELSPHGINVNCIVPVAIEEPMKRPGRTETQIEQWFKVADKTPIRRIGRRQDIANLALFLASDDSSFMSGNDIPLDGGMHILML